MTVEVLPVKVTEVIPFHLQEVKSKIFPMIKSSTWLSKSNDIIRTVDPENFIVCEETCDPDIVIGFVVENRSSESRSFISHKELTYWNISMNELKFLALENLRMLYDKEVNKGKRVVKVTQAGIVYSDQLNDFSASLILLSEIQNVLNMPNQKLVGAVLSNDFLVVCATDNPIGLCMLGELILRQNGNVLLSKKPFRLTNGDFSFYEPTADGEHNIPSTETQLEKSKKRLFPAMQGKIKSTRG